MMKKLLVLMLVLGVASAASAGLTWSQATMTVNAGDIASVDIIGTDTGGSYSVDATSVPVASVTVTTLALAGSEGGFYQYPAGHASYAGYIWLEVKDATEPFTSGPGAQFNLAIDTTGLSGTYMLYADIYDTNDAFTLTVVPEPITMGLLAVGGLFLRRRK